MHMEKVNGLIQFLVIHDRMIAAAKKTYLKDKAEGSWMRKGKVRSRDVAQKEESEGLISIGSQKDQRITEQNR